MVPVIFALFVLGFIGVAAASRPALAGAAAMAVILVLIFVVYIVLEMRNWKRMNRRLAGQQPRWWWKWWQRPSYPSPTTDQGVERQFWHALGCGLLICAICVACGAGPVILILLSEFL